MAANLLLHLSFFICKLCKCSDICMYKMIPIPNHGTDWCYQILSSLSRCSNILIFHCIQKCAPTPLLLPHLQSFILFYFLFSISISLSRRLMRELHWNLMKVCQNACGANRNRIVCAEIFTTLKMHL